MVLNNEIKEIVFRLCAKNGHGAPSIPDYNHYANLANIDLFNFYANPQKTVGQKNAPRTSVGFSKLINGVLKPFIKTATLSVVSGEAELPTDLEVMDTMSYGDVSVRWVANNEVRSYLMSTIDTPTLAYPIYSDTAEGFSIYPDTVAEVDVTYLKTPVTVNWAYTLVSGRPQYDEAETVNFEWGQSQKLSLITRILGYIGVEIRDGELLNYVNNEQQKAS